MRQPGLRRGGRLLAAFSLAVAVLALGAAAAFARSQTDFTFVPNCLYGTQGGICHVPVDKPVPMQEYITVYPLDEGDSVHLYTDKGESIHLCPPPYVQSWNYRFPIAGHLVYHKTLRFPATGFYRLCGLDFSDGAMGVLERFEARLPPCRKPHARSLDCDGDRDVNRLGVFVGPPDGDSDDGA